MMSSRLALLGTAGRAKRRMLPFVAVCQIVMVWSLAKVVVGAPPLVPGVVDVFKAAGEVGGGGPPVMGSPVSYWGPSLLRTISNRTLFFAEADRKLQGHDPMITFKYSDNDGKTWSNETKLLDWGSPVTLYSKSTDTIFVFTLGNSNPSSGPPYRLAAGECNKNSNWVYNHLSGQISSPVVGEGLYAAIGIPDCNVINSSSLPLDGVTLAVGIQTSPTCAGSQNHEPKYFGFDLENKTEAIIHRETGLCLTIPPRASARLTRCSGGEGQRFTFEAQSVGPTSIKLAPGMFRAGECLSVLKTISQITPEPNQIQRAHEYPPCMSAMMSLCNSTRLRDPVRGYPQCRACLQTNAAILAKAKCPATGNGKDPGLAEFCGGCSHYASGGCDIGPAPQSGEQPADTTQVVLQSRDGGNTFSPPMPIKMNARWTTYAGNGVGHGIEMVQQGPNRGRLAMARRYDCRDGSPDFARSFVMYSDDHGQTWSIGQLLPVGWTECMIAELKNGSLLLTSRGALAYLEADPPIHRMFARSDDGGETWAATWFLHDNPANDAAVAGSCEHTIVSDPLTGTVYWSHPGATNFSRSNYTVSSSTDGGWTWRSHLVIYPSGAGYSDSWLLPATLSSPLKLMVGFQRTLYISNAEGGGYNMALGVHTFL